MKFWDSTMPFAIGTPEYVEAFTRASRSGSPAIGKFRSVILRFLDSSDFSGLAPRTQRDMKVSFYHAKNGIDKKFGDAPIAAFDDPRIRVQALDWRDDIGGKVGDDRIRHLQRLIAFAYDRGTIRHHHLQKVKSVYKSNRSETFWTIDEIAAFQAGAPDHIWRILAIALETGLRPGDLVIRTSKRQRLASIPVTKGMAALIAVTPKEQSRLITTLAGAPYRHENYLGDAVSEWRDRLKIRKELRLYDARGTAATRLLGAGADLKEIATHMGWSLKHASEVIERYVALSPDMSDSLAGKLKRAEKSRKLQTRVQTGGKNVS